MQTQPAVPDHPRICIKGGRQVTGCSAGNLVVPPQRLTQLIVIKSMEKQKFVVAWLRHKRDQSLTAP